MGQLGTASPSDARSMFIMQAARFCNAAQARGLHGHVDISCKLVMTTNPSAFPVCAWWRAYVKELRIYVTVPRAARQPDSLIDEARATPLPRSCRRRRACAMGPPPTGAPWIEPAPGAKQADPSEEAQLATTIHSSLHMVYYTPISELCGSNNSFVFHPCFIGYSKVAELRTHRLIQG